MNLPRKRKPCIATQSPPKVVMAIRDRIFAIVTGVVSADNLNTPAVISRTEDRVISIRGGRFNKEPSWFPIMKNRTIRPPTLRIDIVAEVRAVVSEFAL